MEGNYGCYINPQELSFELEPIKMDMQEVIGKFAETVFLNIGGLNERFRFSSFNMPKRTSIRLFRVRNRVFTWQDEGEMRLQSLCLSGVYRRLQGGR